MSSSIEQFKEFAGRVERDLNQFESEMVFWRDKKYGKTLQESKEQLNDCSQILINCSVVLTTLTNLKRRLNSLYSEAGQFQMQGSKRALVQDIEEFLSTTRASLYALIERSKCIRAAIELINSERELESTQRE